VTRPLVPGARADLVELEPLPGDDPIRSIVRRASARHVRAVFVDGRKALAGDASPAYASPTERLPAPQQSPLAAALADHVADALGRARRLDAVALPRPRGGSFR
jgi:cytosine/adenosine deaminase-related metal-dependent hydrolase